MYLESIYNENILINIKDLNNYLKQNSNINDYLLENLKQKIGNKCNNDGLVMKESINIIYRDCGNFKHNERILYKLKYSTKVLFPTEGCILNNCKIIFISSVLYIAKMKENNLIIILPRSFIKKPLDVKKNKYINILCLDKYYELNDRFMFIIGIPFFEPVSVDKIDNSAIDDTICKNIFQNITEFKDEYKNLFNKLQKEQDDELLIEYEETSTPIELNSVLVTLIENLDLHIKTNYKSINYKINTNLISNYKSIQNIYNLLQLPIDSLSKYNVFMNYDLYLKNKNKIISNNFIKTNNSFTLINNRTNCYIISSLQLLKHCKLFIKSFYDLFDKIELSKDEDPETYKLFLELNKIFTGQINNIEYLLELLDLQNKSKNLNFDFSLLNNIEDFITFLFSIIDKNIDSSLYIKNVYDDVSIRTTKTNTENNIGYYINKLNTSNNNSILNKFCNINVSEYKCATCLFRFYHIKNNFTCNLAIDDNDNISKCFHNLNIVPELVEGLECNVCNNNTIYKSLYLYLNPADYLIFNINRVLFEETLVKNNKELFINNRITFKNIDINSTNSIKTNDYILDLKSVICHLGTLSNGHYICLNKMPNNSFYLYDDDKKYIVTHDKFVVNTMFKSEVSNIIYQVNNVNNPLSDILLLEYEEDYLNEHTTDTFINYIKNNNKLGINVKTQMSGGSQTVLESNDNILIRLFKLGFTENKQKYIEIINSFFKNIKNIKLEKEEQFNSILSDYYTENISEIFPKFTELYIYIIHKFTSYFKNKLLDKSLSAIEFLSDNKLYTELLNIHIGSSGYNTNKTNHWDVIYEISNNNLELYSEHFNSIEINDTYYQDFDDSYYTYLEEKLSMLDSKLSVSLVFNKELSDVLLNNNNLEYSDLEQSFQNIFNKYYNNKIELIEDYIHNIVFIFDSSFVYNDTNFNNLSLFTKHINISSNLVFEFNDNSWFNKTVADYFKKNNLSIVTLIINNTNNDFSYNLTTNIDYVDSSDFIINYTKLYGSISKFNGSHNDDLFILLNSIVLNSNKKYNTLSKLEKSNKLQYIYFNNIETDLTNKRYKTQINELEINLTPKFNKSESDSSVSQSNETNEEQIEEEQTDEEQIDDEKIDEEQTDEEKIDDEQTDEEKIDDEQTDEPSESLNYESIDIDSETLTENLNIPSAVFDAKCLYKILDKLNKLK